MSWRIQGQTLRVKATIANDRAIGELVEIQPDFTFSDTVTEESRFFPLIADAKAGDEEVSIQVPEICKIKVSDTTNIQGGSALGRDGNGVKVWTTGTVIGYALGAPDKDGCVPVALQNITNYIY